VLKDKVSKLESELEEARAYRGMSRSARRNLFLGLGSAANILGALLLGTGQAPIAIAAFAGASALMIAATQQ
jgi:hypothetical protein